MITGTTNESEKYWITLRIKSPKGEYRTVRRFVDETTEKQLMLLLNVKDKNGYILTNIFID